MRKRAFSARLLTIILAAGAVGVVTDSPALAITGCPRGTTKHCYGLGRLSNNNNLHAVGANLYVDCLAVTNRDTDFINMEMWLRTQNRRPLADQNWVEAGMTSGTLYSSPGHEKGFIWYWADSYTDQGRYYEHYIGGAATRTSTNVTFTWEGNGVWGVFKGGTRVGGSGVGAYPGDVDLGAESTTYQSAAWGQAVDWQYKNAAGTWNWVNPTIHNTGTTIKAAMPGGTGRAHAQIYVQTPTWRCGGNPPALQAAESAGTESAGAEQAGVQSADAATLLQSEQGTESLLRSNATRVAASLGVPNVGALQYTKSTRTTAVSRTSSTTVLKTEGVAQAEAASTAADNRSVYVVQTRGSFVKDVGHGRDPVRGNVLELVVDAQTGELTDWGIMRDSDGFAALGVAKAG